MRHCSLPLVASSEINTRSDGPLGSTRATPVKEEIEKIDELASTAITKIKESRCTVPPTSRASVPMAAVPPRLDTAGALYWWYLRLVVDEEQA
jgi:hypothetical protein